MGLLGGLGDTVDVETGSFELLANSGRGPVGLDEDDVNVLGDGFQPGEGLEFRSLDVNFGERRAARHGRRGDRRRRRERAS